MKKPIITLAKIKTNERLSDETACFSADLIVDGKVVAVAMNHGHGGCNDYHFKPSCGWNDMTLNDAVKATYPKWVSKWGEKEEFETDLDMVVLTLVEAMSVLKRFRRSMKSKILVIECNEVREFSWKGVKAIEQKHRDAFAKQHPDLVPNVLNDKTDDELLAIIETIND